MKIEAWLGWVGICTLGACGGTVTVVPGADSAGHGPGGANVAGSSAADSPPTAAVGGSAPLSGIADVIAGSNGQCDSSSGAGGAPTGASEAGYTGQSLGGAGGAPTGASGASYTGQSLGGTSSFGGVGGAFFSWTGGNGGAFTQGCFMPSLDTPWPVLSGCTDPTLSWGSRCPHLGSNTQPDYGPFVACCPEGYPFSCPNGTPNSCYATAEQAEAACGTSCTMCTPYP